NLVTSDISQLHIRCYLQTDYDQGGTSTVKCSYPDAIDNPDIIWRMQQGAGDDSQRFDQAVVTVPINAGQSYVKIIMDFVTSGTFTIIGATVYK
ncbi:MAG: hypothetical protein GY920_12120, partial [Aliivibrio sp.]|nr:hypothetical protein [Aliivibrio sp.]